MFSPRLMELAETTVERLSQAGRKCALAESCTGGLVSALLTSVAGSSRVVDRGFVTYSNEAKVEMLGVPAEIIARHGAVSGACAEAMARGALRNSGADVAVSITGIAGPGGGSDAKPVGLVFLAIATREACDIVEMRFGDIGRDAVREESTVRALELLRLA